MEKDVDISKEIKDREIVKEYCKLWLDVLQARAKEVQDAQVACFVRLAACPNSSHVNQAVSAPSRVEVLQRWLTYRPVGSCRRCGAPRPWHRQRVAAVSRKWGVGMRLSSALICTLPGTGIAGEVEQRQVTLGMPSGLDRYSSP